jgi:hypothetical protein
MVATVLVVDSSGEVRDLLRRQRIRADFDVLSLPDGCRGAAPA